MVSSMSPWYFFTCADVFQLCPSRAGQFFIVTYIKISKNSSPLQDMDYETKLMLGHFFPEPIRNSKTEIWRLYRLLSRPWVWRIFSIIVLELPTARQWLNLDDRSFVADIVPFVSFFLVPSSLSDFYWPSSNFLQNHLFQVLCFLAFIFFLGGLGILRAKQRILISFCRLLYINKSSNWDYHSMQLFFLFIGQ